MNFFDKYWMRNEQLKEIIENYVEKKKIFQIKQNKWPNVILKISFSGYIINYDVLVSSNENKNEM